jgi:PIN domain nuclease of toxin-antitoxin system
LRLLLDTCALIWWFADDPRLGPRASGMIEGADAVFVSAASLWEIAIKRRLGKLRASVALLDREIRRSGWAVLPILPGHLAVLETLPAHHRDPFGQLMISQAIAEDLAFVTDDGHAPLYAVRCIACGG